MAKMTLKVKVTDPYFQYQPRVSHDACLVQIWWSQLKFVTNYRADKVKFTDGRTDVPTDGRTSLENLISAAMKQAAPHTCFFFLVFFI